MAKKVLSIKDFKEILKIVKKTDKKKKKRKRNKKTLTNVRSSSQMSSSSQMIPINVSTLQSENLLLQNKALENKIANVDNKLIVSEDIDKLQNDINSMKSYGQLMFKDVYSKYSNLSNIKSKNMNRSNVARYDIYDDNIDVPTTGGDNTFQNLKTAQTEPTFESTYDFKD